MENKGNGRRRKEKKGEERERKEKEGKGRETLFDWHIA